MEILKTPDVQFRPIQLTIVDLIGIFFPGFAWLTLVLTTFYVFSPDPPVHPASPTRILQGLPAQFASTWTLALGAVASAILIGYALKPLAMGMTERLLRIKMVEPALRHATKLGMRGLWEKMSRRCVRFPDLKFPFDCLHEDQEYFRILVSYFESHLHCQVATLPGHGLFTLTKRFLRLSAPPLWEESEHMEAEARMVGSTLLAALYSFFLSVLALLRYRSEWWEIGSWCALSAVAVAVLSLSFIRTRDREVSYTYINSLLLLSTMTSATGPSAKTQAAGQT